MYAKVENNTIIITSYHLPKSTNITSNFYLLSETKRNMQGWYKCVDQAVAHDYTGPDYEFVNNQVIRYVKEIDPYIEAKNNALSNLDNAYQDKINEGYTDNTLQITLRCDDEARAKFTQMKSHLQGIEKGNYPIWDKSGIKSILTTNEYKSLLIAYGDYLINLEEAYNDYLFTIETSTIEQLQGLTFNF